MGGEKNMRIGVIIDSKLDVGGGFQHVLATVLTLSKQKKYEFFFFVFSKENLKILEKYELKVYFIKNNLWDKIFLFFSCQSWFLIFNSVFNFLISSFEKKIQKFSLDLIYFPGPSPLILCLKKHNYVINVFDLAHRDFPEFPEVNFNYEFELREIFYNRVLKKAVAIIADSPAGKEKIVKLYQIDPSRVFYSSYLPSVSLTEKLEIDIHEKYQIDKDYIFYPAQFWSHKNHVYIIDTISVLRSQGIEICAVFSGSDKGNLNFVMKYAKEKGVYDLIKYLGFIPSEDLYSLYKNAIALVMPTYFGPTNIPPLEAFLVGVPVIYSDLPELKEQLGGAGLLCDLKDPASLADTIVRLINDKKLREQCIIKGKERLEELTRDTLQNSLEIIIENYKSKLKCWKEVKL